MKYQVEQLKKAMFIGERLIWAVEAQTRTVDDEMLDRTRSRDVYFTNHRILWNVAYKMPAEIPYQSISSMGHEGQVSGGLGGVSTFFGGGGTIEIRSSYAYIFIQFKNKESLDYANWLLNTGARGGELQPVAGVPNVEGERDPNAPPPAPSNSNCFIATAAYGSPVASEVFILREYRDEILLKNRAGQQFVALYYRLSPPLARVIGRTEILRKPIRLFLSPLVWLIRKK